MSKNDEYARPGESPAAADVLLVIENDTLRTDARRALEYRGFHCSDAPGAQLSTAPTSLCGVSWRKLPSPDEAKEFGEHCLHAARRRHPVVILLPQAPDHSLENLAAQAYLRGCGAILCQDPDDWLETLILLGQFGVPKGPNVVVVAPPESWLHRKAQLLADRARLVGQRFPEVFGAVRGAGPTDIALVDVDSAQARPADTAHTGISVIPVVARPENALSTPDAAPALWGLQTALLASQHAGTLARRLDGGLGPNRSSHALNVDSQRLDRQLEKLHDRAGDHECKVLLAAYGISVTRQAVATTPSAAARLAKRAGFPVEMKPWGADVPSELDGCPLERDIYTAAEVRRAFAVLTENNPEAVIVREAPPQAQEVHVELLQVPPLGWIVFGYMPNRPHPVAAPGPLRRADADYIVGHLVASRAADTAPDRQGLSDLLIRASALVADYDRRIESLSLHRIVILGGNSGALVVDASARLRDPDQ